jgi:hypothetical protein
MPKATCNIGLPKISNNLPPTGHAPMDNPGLGMIRVEEVWGYSQTTKLNVISHSQGRGSFKKELQRNAVPTNTPAPLLP